MRILLDTHVALWFLYKSEKLPQDIRELIASSKNEVYISIASLWEIEIKHDKHPDKMPYSAAGFLQDADGMFDLAGIGIQHVFELPKLAPIHSDPFDRILIAQAKCDKMRLITADGMIAKYGYTNILAFQHV